MPKKKTESDLTYIVQDPEKIVVEEFEATLRKHDGNIRIKLHGKKVEDIKKVIQELI